jgi:hypothetical protein
MPVGIIICCKRESERWKLLIGDSIGGNRMAKDDGFQIETLKALLNSPPPLALGQ